MSYSVVTLSTLRLTRGHLKGSLTKLSNYTDSINDTTSLDELEVKFCRAEDLWTEFNASQNKMYEFADEENYVDPVPEFEEAEAKYLSVKTVLQSAIRVRQRAVRSQDVVSRLADQQQVLIDTLNKSHVQQGSDSFLPTFRIEPFSGNYHEWPTFRDMFESAVHNKASLKPVQKFHLLKSSLRNEALNLLNHLPVCDASYEQAWERLERRYDRPRYVINSYVKTFMDLPSAHSLNVVHLRKISNGADEIIRGLKSINSVNRDPWLIYILLNKLDPETRQAWSTESVSVDYPTIDEFIEFLERRCEALESCTVPVREHKSKKLVARSLHTSSPSIVCPKCSSAHGLSQCPDFLSMSIQARREFVKVNRVCYNCLKNGHSSARCQSKFRCRTCNTRHHTLVHEDSIDSNLNPAASTFVSNATNRNIGNVASHRNSANISCAPSTSGTVKSVINNHSLNIGRHIPQTLLPTAIGKVLDVNGRYQPVRILIDSGSQVSFVTESCVHRLGLKRTNARIPINGIGSTSAGKSRGLTSLVIKSRCDKFSILVDTFILSNVTTNLPTNSFSIEDWDHLCRLDLADPCFNQSNSVDILLGADQVWEILQGNVVHSKHGHPIAHKTIFGYVIAGKLPFQAVPGKFSYHSVADVDAILQSFWTIEEIGSKSCMSLENREIEDHFNRTHRRNKDGRYVVQLPFISSPQFANTLNGAVSRLMSMERKFSKDQNLFESYSKFLDEYLSLGHMSKIPASEIANRNVFYLPHHAVLKPDSSTTKLRVVFDGSYKDTAGNSLNDSLLIGPPIQRNLFSVCIRFRRHKIVFTADIIKMFRQIYVSDEDSDFQRIVWRKSPTEPLQHFRLRTVTYGTSCAPYLSVRALEQLARDYVEEYPIASEIILNDFYVDDVVSGGDTISEAIFKKRSLIELLAKCGMELSKWQSNCPELREESDSLSVNPISLNAEVNSWTNVLGLYWNSQCDVFSFRLNYSTSESITKRQILRDVARIFDPLGFLTPSVIQLKIFFQELWLLKLDWDDEVPPTMAEKWCKFRDELPMFTKIEIPRNIGLSNSSLQLHGFSDASASAYAAVIYSRYELSNGTFRTIIVAAKSRVSPLKQLSIPRLELCAALLLARLLDSVQKSLKITFENVYSWSDSKVVLSWLSSPPRRWNVFIGNRTAEILDTIPRNRWFHVRSTCNPADCASRGIPPSQLIAHPIWWTGPTWLQGNSGSWPIMEEAEDDPRCLDEVKSVPAQSYFATNEKEHPIETLAKGISSWNTLLRTVARFQRFIARYRKPEVAPSDYLRPQEIYDAKKTVIRWLQSQYFGDCIKSINKPCSTIQKQLLNLSPFLDDDNILRVGGRIQEANVAYSTKHPIILPKGHAITRLIVLDAHNRYLHPGISTLFALIRQEYWVLGCRNLIRKITFECIPCFRQRKLTASQLMGNLPRERIQQSRPFANCGCDYAGPITLKVKSGRKSTFSKGYISLFVCLVSKAIHLELVSDLTTDAFLAAFRRFVARRGKPSHLYSDNATNFRGAARKLSEMHKLVLSTHFNSMVAESLARDGITWHFIPPSAPHFGGLWEAGVKSVKQHLRRVIGLDTFTFEQYYTLLTQIEAVLNSRPLCQISDHDLDPLTPAHFFLGESYAAVPEPSLEVPTNQLSCWQQLQAKVQGYWKRWQVEYLTSLQQRPRWQQVQANIQVNDLVVIKDADLPPGKWAMGRVLETHPGKDGHVRVVTLKTANGNLVRPIHKLAKLPVC